ncbi:MAG: hypothetical protein JO001_30225, partial [Alphaproteobacteria bacterium]|nr:hypothetical protein [Alphaproteobacteria bacterium]
MPADVCVTDDGELFLEIERQRVSLSPSQGFTLAQALIRASTRAIIVDETDRVAVLNTVQT